MCGYNPFVGLGSSPVGCRAPASVTPQFHYHPLAPSAAAWFNATTSKADHANIFETFSQKDSSRIARIEAAEDVLSQSVHFQPSSRMELALLLQVPSSALRNVPKYM
jgi:hypothetical protein